ERRFGRPHLGTRRPPSQYDRRRTTRRIAAGHMYPAAPSHRYCVCSTRTKSFLPMWFVLGEVKVWVPEFAKFPIVAYVAPVGSYHLAVTVPVKCPMFTVKFWDPWPLAGL